MHGAVIVIRERRAGWPGDCCPAPITSSERPLPPATWRYRPWRPAVRWPPWSRLGRRAL